MTTRYELSRGSNNCDLCQMEEDEDGDWIYLPDYEALRSACQKMLDCTGGSKHWNGETHEALKAIEAAMGIDP